MKFLVVYCHPCADSFNAAVRNVTLETLAGQGHEARLLDLYEEGFDPVMRASEWRGYTRYGDNLAPVRGHVEQLLWAEGVVFIYPTWWYGLPAMLKGWLERVLVPGFAFDMPTPEQGPRPKLRHISRVVALTTCGASPLVSWVMGQPGRRTLLRGFRSICSPFCRTKYLALYRMDTVSDTKRRAHLERVRRAVAAIAT